MAKNPCPIDKARFMAKSQPVVLSVEALVGGAPGTAKLVAAPKEFSTGSYGFYHNGKLKLSVDGVDVEFQVGITLTAVGSKPEQPQ